jgi:hypothetical protein
VTDSTTPEGAMFILHPRVLTTALPAWESMVVVSIFVRTTMSAATFSVTEGSVWLLLTAGPIVATVIALHTRRAYTASAIGPDVARASSRVALRTGGKS